MNDTEDTGVLHEVELDEVLAEIRTEQVAFEMFLEGYKLRVRDETEQPSSLRDRDGFADHIRNGFRRAYDDVE